MKYAFLVSAWKNEDQEGGRERARSRMDPTGGGSGVEVEGEAEEEFDAAVVFLQRGFFKMLPEGWREGGKRRERGKEGI
jgi:hypothetical protein